MSPPTAHERSAWHDRQVSKRYPRPGVAREPCERAIHSRSRIPPVAREPRERAHPSSPERARVARVEAREGRACGVT